jgi:uncharacterized protein (DUF362 family)/Pyruvate/2-oxoacid:ferredoxin oxidoreductase delta subunit
VPNPPQILGGKITLTSYRVVIARCPDYDPDNLTVAVNKLFAELAWQAPAATGLTAFLKPNLLMARVPDHCVTTHPSLLATIGRHLGQMGYRIVIGDSPGGPFTPSALRRVYETTAMTVAAAECGGELSFDTSSREVAGRDLPSPRNFLFTTAALDNDLLVNVCKLKTHGLTGVTAAAKNLFGCVPGLEKTKFHMNQPSVESFSDAMADIARTLAPKISICDAVLAMEGAGPSHGRPKHMGLVMASTDPFALDYAIARLLGVGPDGFTTLAAALRRGYGPQTDDQLEVVLVDGADRTQATGRAAATLLRSLRPAEFELLPPENLSGLQGRGAIKTILRAIQPWLRSQPRFSRAKCTKCGTCLRSCPAKALRMGDGKPVVDLDACIRCYCCQELCPEGAVEIYRTPLHRLLYGR